MKLQVIPLILVAVALGAAGQVYLKQGVQAYGDIGSVGRLLGAFGNLRVLAGFFLYGLSSLMWLRVLSMTNLSYAYPFIALSYVVVVFLGWKLLGEQVNAASVAGLACICVGVIILAVGGKA